MKIELVHGDITTIECDVIVNAANTSLLGGGGVDGAIHRKGGPTILEECRMIRARQGKCNTGEAVITTAGKLPAKHVIHTVGPVWNGGSNEEHDKLKSCYLNSLVLAERNECKSIAFPGISTGIYKFPKELAADIAVSTVRAFPVEQIEKVIFVCFDMNSFKIYQKRLTRNDERKMR